MSHTIKGLIVLASFTTLIGCGKVAFAPSSGDQSGNTVNDFVPGPGYKSDAFTQTASGTGVDVLVIVDDSQSMAEDQQKLGQKISTFLDYLVNVDWQLGVTTTDTSGTGAGQDGQLLAINGSSKILNRSVANYEQKFLDTVVRTSVGSGYEKPLRALQRSIERRGAANSGFFRNETNLAVVILSDEDETATGSSDGSPSAAMNAFASAWGGMPKQMRAYGITIHPTNTACYNEQNSSGGRYADIISQFVTLTSGIFGNICDPDYGPTLAKIGDHVQKLSFSFPLSSAPDRSSVVVQLIPAQASAHWILDGQSIRFDVAPQDGSQILVHYREK